LSGLAKKIRGRWWTSNRWARSDPTGEEEEPGVVRQTSKSGLKACLGRKGGKKKKKEKNFFFIFRIYFREKNNLEITR
jgi:hypothetical protein